MSNYCGRAKLLCLEEFCKNMGFYIRHIWRFWLVWGSSKWTRNKKLGKLRGLLSVWFATYVGSIIDFIGNFLYAPSWTDALICQDLKHQKFKNNGLSCINYETFTPWMHLLFIINCSFPSRDCEKWAALKTVSPSLLMDGGMSDMVWILYLAPGAPLACSFCLQETRGAQEHNCQAKKSQFSWVSSLNPLRCSCRWVSPSGL